MTDTMTYQKLTQLIDRVQMTTQPNDSLILHPTAWLYELERNPQYFYRNNNGELMYGGYRVETIISYSDDGERFWSTVDKVIPKEN